MDNLTKEDILKYLRDNKEMFAKEYGVSSIGLFGSYARDEATSESDIDIVIDGKNIGYFRMFDLKDVIEQNLNKKVDIGLFHTFRTLIKKEVEKDIIYV